ncbi:hypothetical protein G6F32_016916 [Rhizopus arrhizus]|nr:hypothetical protein G6F32_016916 [Rhizopus arrhizus]
MALSLNIWAPTGKYNASDMANPSLNNWPFIPQVAYTKIFPESGFQLDTVAGSGRDGAQDVQQWRQRGPDPGHPAATGKRQRPDGRPAQRLQGA